MEIVAFSREMLEWLISIPFSGSAYLVLDVHRAENNRFQSLSRVLPKRHKGDDEGLPPLIRPDPAGPADLQTLLRPMVENIPELKIKPACSG